MKSIYDDDAAAYAPCHAAYERALVCVVGNDRISFA